MIARCSRLKAMLIMAQAAFALQSCGSNNEEEEKADAFTIGVKDGGQNGTSEDAKGFHPDNSASLTAFSETLWPVLKDHCSQCHSGSTSPFFAVEDKFESHKTVITSHLVAPAAAPSSRFVTRLSLNNHNCWTECPKDADVMLNAIKAWLDKAGIKNGGDNLLRIGPVPVSSAKEIILPGGGGNWVREAENYDALGDAFEVADEGTASQKKVMKRNSDQNATGEVSYHFPIPEGTGYQLWVRVRDQGTGRGIRYRINGGAEQNANLNDNSGEWFWLQTQADMTLKPLGGFNHVTFAITATNLMVDMIAFTKNATFDRGLIENTGKRKALEFDLSPTIGKKAKLILHYADGLDGASYILSHPTIQLDEPMKLKVEKIYVLANGEFNPQYSTFASLSQVVEQSLELSPRGLVVQKKDAADAMTIGFGKLEIVP